MNKNNQKCVLCHSYLFEDDDVVYCPECGAPHHRECYFKTGTCALKDKHGTDEEYKKQPPVQEQPKQDTPDYQPQSHGTDYGQTPFNFNIPFNDSSDLNKELSGFKIRDILSFVFLNPFRYMQKFQKIAAGKKVGFNWAAFLFPSQWMILRKMYKRGILVFLLSLSSLILMLPLASIISELDNSSASNIYAMIPEVSAVMQKASPTIMLLATIGTFLDLAIRIVCALFGDKFYFNHTISKLEKIKSESSGELNPELLRKVGGINPWLGLLAVLLLNNLPTLIGAFIL